MSSKAKAKSPAAAASRKRAAPAAASAASAAASSSKKKPAAKRAKAADGSPTKAKASSSKKKKGDATELLQTTGKVAKKPVVPTGLSPLDPSLKPSLNLQLSQLTVAELKALMERNEQSHFGLDKVHLIQKIQKLSKTGCVPRCTHCKFGHLKPKKKGAEGPNFRCPGCQWFA